MPAIDSTVYKNLVAKVPNGTPAYVIAPEGASGDNINGVNFSYNVANCNNASAFYTSLRRFGRYRRLGKRQGVQQHAGLPLRDHDLNQGPVRPGE